MLSEDALAQLGIENPTPNMEILLSYYDKNGQQERTFTLSGWFHSYTGVGMGFVSESYCTNAGYTLQEDGVLSLSLNKMPDDFWHIQDDVQLNEEQAFHGAVSMSSSGGSVIAMVIFLVLFIIGSGYLLIYNGCHTRVVRVVLRQDKEGLQGQEAKGRHRTQGAGNEHQ